MPAGSFFSGSDLDALSDDPTQLATELQALAGNSAGPDGGQIYIDGFSSGQLPPKSSIREIRINSNPFSAEFDKLGYGRIEIITKAGSNKFSGHVSRSRNRFRVQYRQPFVQQQPNYYIYELYGQCQRAPLERGFLFFQRIQI